MQVVSRKEAKAAGLTHYFTGKSCVHGHIAKRFTSTGQCSECLKGYDTRWSDDPKKEKLRAKAWRNKNKQHTAAYGKQYRQENRTEVLRRLKAWRDSNPMAMRAHEKTRRARKLNAPGTHTAADVRDILTMQRHHCACCGVKLATYHVDHIVPLSRGGSNDKANLQILCAPCNLSKHAKDPLTFMQERGFLL